MDIDLAIVNDLIFNGSTVLFGGICLIFTIELMVYGICKAYSLLKI